MRKATKVFFIIAGVCILVGAMLSTIAFASANFDIHALSTNGPRIQQHYKAESTNPTSINFVGVADDVKIQSADVKSIEVDYWTNDANYYKFSEDTDSTGTFKMWYETNWWRNIGFDWEFEYEHPVIITVPQSFAGSIQVNSVSGDISVGDNIAKLDTLSMETVSGKIANNTLGEVGTLSAKTVSGEVMSKVSGEVKNSNFYSVSGQIDFEFASVVMLAAESVSGEIAGSLNDLSANDYAVSAESMSGVIDVPISNKVAEKSIRISTLSGNISLKDAGNQKSISS